MPAASQHPSARPAAQAAGIGAGRRQAIANGRRIGDDGRGRPRGELRFQGFDFSRQLDGAEQLGPLADNAAQLAGFVRRKLAFRDAAEEISEDSAQSCAVFRGRSGKWIGAPRREGIALSIKRRAALTSPSLVAASKRASNSVSMFWTTFRLKRSLACLVKVMVSDFGRPPLFLGGGASGRGRFGYIVGHGETQLRARRNYSAAPSYVHAETIAPVSLIVAPHA